MNFYDQFRIPRGERWIRLLQVHACYGYKKEGAPVQCDLFVVDLDTQPQFSALSYVWGVATDNPRTILCGGTELAVTPNCYSALSHLRQYLGTFTIWVDAICIDQNNEEDKVHQIPLMGDIYSGASTVYAWLGEGNPASARAMAYLANAGFSRFFFKGGSLVGGELQPSRVWGATVEHVISRLSLKRSYILTEGPSEVPTRTYRSCYLKKKRFSTSTDLASFEDLEALLDCEWIDRIWTFQETVLARNIVIVCGNRHVAWSRFAISVLFLNNIRDSATFKKWMEIVCSVQNFGQFREKKCETPLHAGSTDVLVRYWDFLSKIPARQKTLHRGILFGHVVLIVALVLIKILFQTHVLAMTPDTSLAIHAKRAIYAILAILSISLFLSQLYHVLALNPAFPVLPISRQRRIRAGISRTMYERIHISLCSRKATNPRDMSFGIHCVLKTDSKAKSLLPLDYRLPCEVVYMQLASFLLHESGTLDVLILAAQGRYLHAPSWVPDFSQILHPTAVAHETETMSATLYSAPIWSFMNYDPHALAVKGFLCEEIIATFGFIQTDDRFLITEAPLHIKNLDTMLRLTESSTLLNCLRTLSPEVLFQSGSDISASAKVFRFFRSYLRWLQRNHQRRAFKLLSMLQQSHLNSTVVYSNLKRSGISSGLNIGRLTYQDLLYVHIKVCNVFACQKLKFFRTMTSAGYCYNDPAIGDRLALVSGVSIPLIVRPCESSVNLVSLAVLDNEYMAGFVWREIFRNRRNNWLASRTDQGAAIDIKTFLSSDAWLDDIIIS